MKLSNKLFFATCLVGFIALVAEKLAIRAAYSNRQKVNFEPGYVEKPVTPFKVVVVDSRLSPNSELRIEKSDRFALASDQNFWNSTQVSQNGDTLFIHQTTEKHGRVDDPTDRSVNHYAKIAILCPAGLAAVRSDISLYLNEIESDSLTIEQSPNRNQPDFIEKNCKTLLKNCQTTSLRIASSENARVEFDENCTTTNLRLMLRDSASAEVNGLVNNAIWLDCSAKSSVSVSGANLSKIKN